MVEIYLDTASIDEIKKILPWRVISGITTNQQIFLKEKGCNFEKRAKEILELVEPLPVSLEGPNDELGIEKFARLVKLWNQDSSTPGRIRINGNPVIKVPMLGNGSGLRVIDTIRSMALKTNVTACMTLNQTALACLAGATYVSLFYNRMIDWKYEQLRPEWKKGQEKIERFLQASKSYALLTIADTMQMIKESKSETKLIVGSIRNPKDVEEILSVSPHIITITPDILKKMPYHEKTEETLKEFDESWVKFCEAEKQ